MRREYLRLPALSSPGHMQRQYQHPSGLAGGDGGDEIPTGMRREGKGCRLIQDSRLAGVSNSEMWELGCWGRGTV